MVKRKQTHDDKINAVGNKHAHTRAARPQVTQRADWLMSSQLTPSLKAELTTAPDTHVTHRPSLPIEDTHI